MSVTIPQTLFAALTASFDSESKRIARDAARILRVPEKEVLGLLKNIPKVKLQVCDDTENPTTCPMIGKVGSVQERCRKPCVLGTGRCFSHQTATIPKISESQKLLTRLERIADYPEPLWCDEATRDVQNREGKIIGCQTEDAILELQEQVTEAEKTEE